MTSAETKKSRPTKPPTQTRALTPRHAFLATSALALAVASVASRFYELHQYGTAVLNILRPPTPPVPIVSLDYGTFEGIASAHTTESFLGMPFAQPP